MVLVFVLLAAACGGDDPSGEEAGDSGGSPQPTDDAGEPVSGGELNYAYHLDATSLDVVAIREYFNNVSDGGRAFAIYDLLFTSDPDTGEVEPRIAESLESDDGGATFTLKLRDGVEFSDGTPYDAAAVQFNWERLQDPANSAPTAQYADMVSGFEVVDDLTLRFTVSPATPRFEAIVARYLSGVGSPTAITELGAGFGDSPVGAGPFVVEEFVRGSHIQLTRNENYWREGMPYLDELRMQFVPDEQQRLQALIGGDVQMAQTADTQRIGEAVDAGLAEYTWVTGGGRWMSLNANEEPFDDPTAVDAVRVAFDRETFVANAEGERGIPAESFFREDHPFYNEDAEFPAYDPGRAQELLDDYADETGGPLSFTLTVPEATRSSGEQIQALLSAYDNIDVEIEVLPTADYLTRIYAQEFQANISAVNFVDPFPVLHQQLRSDSPRNSAALHMPEVDAALDDAAAATDIDERREAYGRVQSILAEEGPIVMLVRPQNAVLYNDDEVENLEFYNDNLPNWDEVWLAP